MWLSNLPTQVSGRLGMSGGISPRHAQNPLSGERRKTLSITHHALSPPPSHHHLCIIHLINWLQRFYRIIVSLKRPFVPKSDVKQWFTTTTTSNLPIWDILGNLFSVLFCQLAVIVSTGIFTVPPMNWHKYNECVTKTSRGQDTWHLTPFEKYTMCRVL